MFHLLNTITALMHEPTDIEYNMHHIAKSLCLVECLTLVSCFPRIADFRVEAAKSELGAKSSDRGYHWQRPPPWEASEQSHRKLTQNRGSLPEVSSYGA